MASRTVARTSFGIGTTDATLSASLRANDVKARSTNNKSNGNDNNDICECHFVTLPLQDWLLLAFRALLFRVLYFS